MPVDATAVVGVEDTGRIDAWDDDPKPELPCVLAGEAVAADAFAVGPATFDAEPPPPPVGSTPPPPEEPITTGGGVAISGPSSTAATEDVEFDT